MTRTTMKVALVAAGICALVGCTGEGGVGVVSAAHSAYDDAGTPPPPPPPTCTYTQGFWKNHPDAWPVTSLVIGGQSYTQAQLLAILRTPPRGDASLILAHQLIAALLNGASGALVDAAQAWMTANADADGRLPYNTPRGSAAHIAATTLADALAAYNEGTTGPGHCDDPPLNGIATD